MYTNNHVEANIASYGYGTKHPFMTLHVDRKSIWTVDQLPGKEIFKNQENTIRIKDIFMPEEYTSVSVYRSDIVPGCAHVSLGKLQDVFMPVNMTTASVSREDFTFFFETIADTYYCLMVRSAYIKNLGDIEKYKTQLAELSNSDYRPEDNGMMSRYTIETRKGNIVVFAYGTAQHPLTWKTNNGKRLLACFEKYAGWPVWRHIGLDVKTMDQNVHTFWKIVYIKGNWYRWIYICDSPVATEEFIPTETFKRFNEFSLVETAFILHDKNQKGEIIATLFHEDGTFHDMIIPSEIHEKEDFDLRKYVLRNYRTHIGDRIINLNRKERVS